MKAPVENQLAAIRKSRGVGVSELARRLDISRHTIHAIEIGTYVPNTELALRLAAELEVTVDELFSLSSTSQKAPDSVVAEVLSPSVAATGDAVRICQIGSRWISVPASARPYYMPESDGIVKRTARADGRADVIVFAKDDSTPKRIVLAGCDPATSLLARMVEKSTGVEIVSAAASSKLALTWLKEGKVHIAGSHLEDPTTGEFNLPFIRKEFPDEDFILVTFARWQEGFVVAPGNPKGVRKIEDLTRKNVRFVNREIGSGSRALLDQLLDKAGIKAAKIPGYGRVAHGHLAAAYHVVVGDADACLATQSAAQTFGLDFLPLSVERYDLVMRKRTTDLPAVKAFLDVLQRATLRRKLEALAGYDTSQTGVLVA